MVACLERTVGNAEFHQIMDFLTSSPIHYALTVSPTIYASYIEQFWLTKSKTVNDMKQIHAKVDGKTMVISKSSVRSDLYFNDEDEPFNDVYVTPAHTKKIFTNMKRQNKDFSRTITPLFDTMLVPPVVEGEGSGQPSEPQPPSSTAPPEQVLAAVSQPQKTHIPRRTKRGRDTEIPQSSGPPKRLVMRLSIQKRMTEWELVQVVDPGAMLPHWGIQMLKLDDLMDFVPLTPHDSPLSGGHTSGSDKGSGETEVFDYTTAVEKDVNVVEPVSTAGDAVNTASVIPDVSAAGPSTSTVGDIFEDEMTTIADTLMAIMSTRPRTTLVVIHNVKEEPRRATPLPIVQSQDKEQVQFEREQMIAREKVAEQEARDAAVIEQMEDVQARMDADRFFAAQRTEQIRSKPPTRAQLRNKMATYLKHMGKYTHNQLKSKNFEEIQMLYEREQKWINDFVPMDYEVVNDSEHQAESSKKRSRADHDKVSVKKQKLKEDDAVKRGT
nr:hypothetical protein [Tanacetum cinerariifolium]